MATEQTIVDIYVDLDAKADVTIWVSGKHVYNNTSGTKPWALTIYWAEQVINYAGGAGYGDDGPSCDANVFGAGAGRYRLRITWFGDATMKFIGLNGGAEVIYK